MELPERPHVLIGFPVGKVTCGIGQQGRFLTPAYNSSSPGWV